MKIDEDGKVTLYVGTYSQGQGHATVFPQIIADKLGVDYDSIDVIDGGDTHGEVPFDAAQAAHAHP